MKIDNQTDGILLVKYTANRVNNMEASIMKTETTNKPIWPSLIPIDELAQCASPTIGTIGPST